MPMTMRRNNSAQTLVFVIALQNPFQNVEKRKEHNHRDTQRELPTKGERQDRKKK
jgi:hypothetical protein